MAFNLSCSAVHVASLAASTGTARLALAVTSTGAWPFKVIVFLILAAVNFLLAHLAFLVRRSNIGKSHSQTKLFVGTPYSSSAVRSQIWVAWGLFLSNRFSKSVVRGVTWYWYLGIVNSARVSVLLSWRSVCSLGRISYNMVWSEVSMQYDSGNVTW